MFLSEQKQRNTIWWSFKNRQTKRDRPQLSSLHASSHLFLFLCTLSSLVCHMSCWGNKGERCCAMLACLTRIASKFATVSAAAAAAANATALGLSTCICGGDPSLPTGSSSFDWLLKGLFAPKTFFFLYFGPLHYCLFVGSVWVNSTVWNSPLDERSVCPPTQDFWSINSRWMDKRLRWT